MKITKRHLRRIIREAIAGVAVGPNKGSTFLDLTMRAIEDDDYRKAASYIMDSYMIDDIFPEDENNLMAALSSLPSARRTSSDVEAVADEWLEGIRRADQKAAEEILATRMGDYSSSHMRESKTTRVTRSQLRRLIKERIDVVNRETGEVLVFGRDGREAAPEAAWPDLVKRLGLQPKDDGLDNAGDQSFSLTNQEFDKLEQETLGKQDRRYNKKVFAKDAADRERLNIDSLLQRLRYWAEDAARDYMGDNPGTELQDVAYDLADAWEFEFEADEKEELMWHFDGDLNDLKIYAAESMG